MSYMDTRLSNNNANPINITEHIGMVEVQGFLLRICWKRLISISNIAMNSSKCLGKNSKPWIQDWKCQRLNIGYNNQQDSSSTPLPRFWSIQTYNSFGYARLFQGFRLQISDVLDFRFLFSFCFGYDRYLYRRFCWVILLFGLMPVNCYQGEIISFREEVTRGQI